MNTSVLKRIKRVESRTPKRRRFFARNIGDDGSITENGEKRSEADLMQAQAEAQKENCEVIVWQVVYTATVSHRTKQARRESPCEERKNAETSF